MKAKEKKQVSDILLRHGVVAGYLFGSAARGMNGPLSDIDIAVVFGRHVPLDTQFNHELRIASEIGTVLGEERIDVVNIMTVRNPVLKHAAVLNGVPLLIKDQKLKKMLERITLIEYEDTNYLRETSYKILRRQIKDGPFGVPHHNVFH